MTIRESTRGDYAAVGRLMRFTHSFPADEEKLEELELRRSKDSPYLRQVAEVDGQVVGYSKSQRWETPRPMRYIVAVAVEPEHRGKGIGKKLYDIAEAHAIESGAEFLWIQHPEGDDIAKGFAERRSYQESFYLQDLTLPLKDFDFRPFEGIIEGVQANGIRFVPYSMLGDTDVNRHRLYDLTVALERDVPNFGHDEFMPFEDWRRRTFEAKWFDPAGHFLALDGDQWVGLGAVGEFFPATFVNSLTGVIREYRKRRIALALKLIGIEFARSRGAKEIRTQNHGTNEGMRAINAKLGYQGLPGWFTYEKAV